MSAKRKKDPGQSELPIPGVTPDAPLTPKDTKPNGNGGKTDGNGADHVVAEVVEAVVHRPFDPKKLELGLHTRVDRGFLDYASYVIRDRAIPNLADGLKPVQRRIMYVLHTLDDGRFIKVASVTGETMKYHPHGNASIDDAIVVHCQQALPDRGPGELRKYLHRRPRRGAALHRVPADRARARRSCSTTKSRISSRAMTAAKGAVDAALQTAADADAGHRGHRRRLERPGFCRIISPSCWRRKLRFSRTSRSSACRIFHGRLDGRAGLPGRQRQVKVRAQDQGQGRFHRGHHGNSADHHHRFLMASIEDAARKGKLKVKSINDFTSEDVEIEIKCPAGVEAEKMVDALYAFTDCEVSISSRIIVIKDNRPVELTVSEVLRENTTQLVAILKRELELREKH
jgi:topoisomerase-4 subunit A